MIELNLDPSDRMLRQFAAAWLIVLSILAANQGLLRGHPRAAIALGAAAAIGGGIGLVRPRRVRWLFVALTVAAFPIGWVVSQAMLLVLFLCVVTPVALVFKLTGRDRLARRRERDRQSYWKPKATTADVRRYLRQY